MMNHMQKANASHALKHDLILVCEIPAPIKVMTDDTLRVM